MRRSPRVGAVVLAAVALVAAVAAALMVFARGGPIDPGTEGAEGGADAGPPLREVVDVGARVGLPQDAPSWGIDAGDLSGDGRPDDLVVSYHNSVRAYRHVDGRFEEMFRQDGQDPHDCLIADVNVDGLGDMYCTRGAERGGGSGVNSLWLQGPAGTFGQDVSGEFGVSDPLGRGRHATFVDIDGDPYPDLFVGNAVGRTDQKGTPNRTYLNQRGERFREANLGITREVGGHCAQAVDFDRDGWEDIVVCGERRLLLYRNVEAPDGGRRFQEVARDVGLDVPEPSSAWIEDVDGDEEFDAVVVEADRLRVFPGRDGKFAGQSVDRELDRGKWVVVGNVDGRRGPDIYVTQGCRRRGGPNVEDVLLMNDGSGGFRPAAIPQAASGCGDIAQAMDIDGDRRDEIVVLNGRPLGTSGPVQVLTRSPALAP